MGVRRHNRHIQRDRYRNWNHYQFPNGATFGDNERREHAKDASGELHWHTATRRGAAQRGNMRGASPAIIVGATARE